MKQREWRRRIPLYILLIALVGIVLAGFMFRTGPTKKSPDSQKSLTAQTKSTTGVAYGIALGNTLPPLSQAQRKTVLKQIKSDGFMEVRLNIDWSLVQAKNKDTYDWSSSDSILKAVQDAGLKSVVTLDRTPGWARPAECKTSFFCAPSDIDAFAKFSGLAAARYKSYGVTTWEVWNEPNIMNFWKPLPNPNQYAHMLSATYTAIKQQAPDATVLVGGLSGNSVDKNGAAYIDPRAYLAQLYAARVGDSFDGVAYHPYTSLMMPNVQDDYNGWYKMDVGSYTLRSVMDANGDQNKDVWLTEFGIPTNGPGQEVTNPTMDPKSTKFDHVSSAAAVQITQAALADIVSHPWIRSLDWYTYKDTSGSMSDAGDSYGLYQADGMPKPVLDTLRKAL